MLISEYYEILDLPVNSSIEEIKKAYRKKAQLYHPDVNHSPDAKDKFITVTEAYDFLMANHEKGQLDDQDYFRIVEEWRKYRQDRSHRRAQYYARKSFSSFKNTRYYKSTKLLDTSSVIYSFAIAAIVFLYTILGYIIKRKNPVPGEEKSTLVTFIILLTLSLILLTFSIFNLKSFIDKNKRQKKKR
jgi:hypothetical protein